MNSPPSHDPHLLILRPRHTLPTEKERAELKLGVKISKSAVEARATPFSLRKEREVEYFMFFQNKFKIFILIIQPTFLLFLINYDRCLILDELLTD